MRDEDGSLEDEAVEGIAQAVATLPKALRDIAGQHEPFVLHSAAAAGEVELVQALLDAGLSPDMYPGTEDEDDEPPLIWIARHRDQSKEAGLIVAKLLMERGADVNEGVPLLAAAEEEDFALVSLLLSAGADADLALVSASQSDAAGLRRCLEDLGKGSGLPDEA